MTTELDALELRLIASYEKQIAAYRQALDLLERHVQGSAVDLENIEWTQKLNEILSETATLDAAIAQDKRDWQSAHRSASGRLRDTLTRLGDGIHSLIERINPLMRDLHDRRRQLTPDLDGLARQRQMIQAYAANTGVGERV